MIDQQYHIERIRPLLQPEINSALDEATSAFMGTLGNQPCPGESDVAAATGAAQSLLKRHALSDKWICIVTGKDQVDGDQRSRLSVAFNSVMRPLVIPRPQDVSTASPERLALAGAVGAVLGMMVLTPLARILLDMRDTGLFIGAPVGAGLLVLGSWYVAQNKWIRNMLIVAFGIATITELWQLLSGGGVFGRVWRQLGGRRSGVKRVLVYACAILVLIFSKQIPRISRREYEQTVKCVLNQWIDKALVVLAFLLKPGASSEAGADSEGMLCSLVGKIRGLSMAGKENMESTVEELIQETENMGFSGGERPDEFVWEDSMRDEYDTFGRIEPGDPVIVERAPVFFRDTVKDKGLVRKVRKGS